MGLKNTEVIEMMGFGLSHNKTEIYQTQIDQNNSPELLNLLFNHISIQMTQQMTKHHVNYFCLFAPTGTHWNPLEPIGTHWQNLRTTEIAVLCCPVLETNFAFVDLTCLKPTLS